MNHFSPSGCWCLFTNVVARDAVGTPCHLAKHGLIRDMCLKNLFRDCIQMKLSQVTFIVTISFFKVVPKNQKVLSMRANTYIDVHTMIYG